MSHTTLKYIFSLIEYSKSSYHKSKPPKTLIIITIMDVNLATSAAYQFVSFER